MLKLNNIRNKANAINAIYSLKELGITGDIPAIFTFDDIIINRGLSSRDEPITQTLVPQMKKYERLQHYFLLIFSKKKIFHFQNFNRRNNRIFTFHLFAMHNGKYARTCNSNCLLYSSRIN